MLRPRSQANSVRIPASLPNCITGAGVYWDKHGGCLQGNWNAGTLSGPGRYDHTGYSVTANFARALPHGPCRITLAASRLLPKGDSNTPPFPPTAAAHLRATTGPVLHASGAYALPPGVPLEAPKPRRDEEGGEVAEGGDEGGETVPLPCPPRYEGLSFSASYDDPAAASNMVFPPVDVSVPSCIKPCTFTMQKVAVA
jgi:hypothetical protein